MALPTPRPKTNQRIIAALLAFGIGVSRIYLGYHYLTDVVGGFLAGTVWPLIVGAAFRTRPGLWPWRTTRGGVVE